MSLEVLLIAVGAAGVIISGTADFIGLGRPGFGLNQMSGLIIGALLVMIGLVKVLFSHNRTLLHVLTCGYLSGILLAGLMPFPFNHSYAKVFLSLSPFGLRDFAVNLVGFIPLGYLLMMNITHPQNEGGVDLFHRAICITGTGALISLFIESSQYFFIPGRHSSFIDLMANTIGTLVGLAMFVSMKYARSSNQ